MTHEFELNPNFTLLAKYKYIKLAKNQLEDFIKGNSEIVIEIPSIATEEKALKEERKEIDNALDGVLKGALSKDEIDTVKFICLYHAGYYQSALISDFEEYQNRKAVKQLASFLFQLDTNNDIESITIKTKTKGKSVKVNHPELIQWLPVQLLKGFNSRKLFFEIGKKYLNAFANNDWQKLKDIPVGDYKKIMGKNRAIFIIKVLAFIKNETQIEGYKNAALTHQQSEFIYEVGTILNVFDRDINKYQADSIIRSILKYNKKAIDNLKL